MAIYDPTPPYVPRNLFYPSYPFNPYYHWYAPYTPYYPYQQVQPWERMRTYTYGTATVYPYVAPKQEDVVDYEETLNRMGIL